MKQEFRDERQKQRACDDIRDQIEVKIGQIELLEDEISDKESEIGQLEHEIEYARDEFKDTATEFGVSQVPVIGPSTSGAIFDVLQYGTQQFGAPTREQVYDKNDAYRRIEAENEGRISDLKSDIRYMNQQIRSIQAEKEDLVAELRYLDC